jgi:hypothetical protein
MITTMNISTRIMVSCKYEGGKTVSHHDKGTTALKYSSGASAAYDIIYDSTDHLYHKIHLADYRFYIFYYLYYRILQYHIVFYSILQ